MKKMLGIFMGMFLWQPRFGFTFDVQKLPETTFDGHFGWLENLKKKMLRFGRKILINIPNCVKYKYV